MAPSMFKIHPLSNVTCIIRDICSVIWLLSRTVDGDVIYVSLRSARICNIEATHNTLWIYNWSISETSRSSASSTETSASVSLCIKYKHHIPFGVLTLDQRSQVSVYWSVYNSIFTMHVKNVEMTTETLWLCTNVLLYDLQVYVSIHYNNYYDVGVIMMS